MKKLITALLTLCTAAVLSVSALAMPSFHAAAPSVVTIDGVVSQGEYSQAIYRGVTLAAAEESTDGVLSAWWFDGNHDENAYFDLYVTNDNDAIYIACVVHNTGLDYASDGKELWKCQNFTFSLSDYYPGSTVKIIDYQGEKYEAYWGNRLGLLADGTMKCDPRIQGHATKEIFPGEDYMIKYDPSRATVTYEIAMPLNSTFVDVNRDKNPVIALSAVISLRYDNNEVSCSTDGSNRFLIGKGAAVSGGAGNFKHQNQAILITLNTQGEVDDVFKKDEESSEESSSASVSDIVPSRVEVMDEQANDPEIVVASGASTASTVILIASGVVVAACIVLLLIMLLGGRKKDKPAQTEENEGKDGSVNG